ncbi:MAG: acetylxylan esterase [Saprospiraceae bacterium]
MKFNTPFIKILFSITIFLGCLPVFSTAQITISTAEPNATYQTGETAKFNVSSTTGGQVSYELFYDGTGFNENPIPSTIIASGTLNLQANIPQQISHQATEAGVVLCRINQNINLTAAAAFSPFEIQPFEEEPTGISFDQFWTNAKNELAGIDMAPIVTYNSENNEATIYNVSLGHIDGRRVYGYLSVPKNASGPFPAMVSFPAFGSGPSGPNDGIVAGRAGVLHLSISIHNAAPPSIDPNAYQPNDINDPNTFYYRQAILAGVRSIDYLTSRPDCDVNKIGVMGESQGGGLAIMVAGIDDRVKLLLSSNPISCQNLGIKYDKASGFPKYLQSGWTAQQENSVKYYDAAYFARRYNSPCRFYISYEDLTCPAAGSFSAFNQFSNLKILTHAIEKGHTHQEFINTRLPFIRRYFNTSNIGNPFKQGKGYHIDAGNDLTVSTGSQASLTGIVEGQAELGNNINLITTYNWSQISGPGSVTFTNPQSLSTNASFNSSGTYILQLTVKDDSDSELNNNVNKNFSTLIDRITVTVGNCTDGDNDGVCFDDDCDDGDPTIGGAGSACDDGNANTNNDVLQADCSCAGTPTGGGGNGIADCDAISVTSSNGQIIITGLTATSEQIDLSGQAANWQIVPVCNGDCNDTQVIPNLTVGGSYQVKMNVFGSNNTYCYKEVTITVVGGGGCTDGDSDGVCFDDDCDDGDPAIGAVGSACDDGNANTNNDVLQADCSCAGTPTGGGGNGVADCDAIDVTSSNGQIIITGLTATSEQIDLSGQAANWQIIPVCNGDCSDTQVIPNLTVGGSYQVKMNVYGSNSTYCYKEVTITVVGGSNRIISSDINQLTEVENIVPKEPTKSAINTSYLDESSILLYPNPARGTLFLNLERTSNPNELINISIYNLVGQKMIQKKLNTSDIKARFDISILNNGLYYLSIEENGKKTITKKFVVEN